MPNDRTRSSQRWIMGENPPLELLELWTGVESELLCQTALRLTVDVERGGLATGSVEREHQLRE